MRIAKDLSSWTATFAALCLSGYASVSSARPIKNGPVEEDEGIVLLSIANNTGLGQLQTVWVVRVPDPNERGGRKTQTLTNVTEGLARDTAMFTGIVPPATTTFSCSTVRKARCSSTTTQGRCWERCESKQGR